jgi:2-keto-4-pentenoate hydratase/2-oxohepta-3-ene-1,7-dioic acid hydratase in catechol pathway
MKLASFKKEGRIGFGIVDGDAVLVVKPSDRIWSVKDLLRLRPEERAALREDAERIALADVTLLPPITDPALIIGIGLNTKSHFEETAELMKRTAGDYPKYPRLFMRTSDSHVGHGAPLRIPRVSSELDYEGEIAVMIGKGGRYIEKADALSHIGGYSCYNEGSIRDYQQHSIQVTAGKNFVASGSFGPWITTADDVPDPDRLTLPPRRPAREASSHDARLVDVRGESFSRFAVSNRADPSCKLRSNDDGHTTVHAIVNALLREGGSEARFIPSRISATK